MESTRSLRRRFADSLAALERVESLARLDTELRGQIASTAAHIKSTQVVRRLAEIPLESMRDVADIPLRLSALPNYGISSVASVYLAETHTLERIPGISALAALEMKAIADEMYAETEASTPLSIAPDLLSRPEIQLLSHLRTLQALSKTIDGKTLELQVFARELAPALHSARALQSRIRWILSGSRQRSEVVKELSRLLDSAVDSGLAIDVAQMASIQDVRSAVVSQEALQQDFRNRASDFYAVLENALGRSSQFGQRHFDDELLERILAQEVDHSLIRATLRRYQVFGTQFALAQGRVIIGDEMGLGKTLQALSLLAQRWRDGATHFLIVTPASVLVNWEREIVTRTVIPVMRIHGETQGTGLDAWISTGGIAITTFDTLKGLGLSDEAIRSIPVDTLVADEAHYVKNPQTGRALHLLRWLRCAPRAVFLTGTPLENRVDEFVNLVEMLDESVSKRLNRVALAAGAESFRRQAAVVYLRRNVAEVLSELPQLLEVDEYCTWDGAAYPIYLDGVAKGNLMAMRKAGMLPSLAGRPSSKMSRLLEIASEAFANGEKVLVFSYFRDVLDEVARCLGPQALGPITGDTTPNARQRLVDEFTASTKPLALVGQIQAAGSGLNIQAASVVILCEPQVKPSLEVQAIARAHRMGQVRTVQVHRLMIPDSVDSRIAEILVLKQVEFDTYAAVSALADAAPSSKAAGDYELAKVIVLAERRRLGMSEPSVSE